MTRIYILRKHYRVSYGGFHTAFEIAGTFATRAKCKAAAEEKNKRTQKYIYFVGVVTLKGGAA